MTNNHSTVVVRDLRWTDLAEAVRIEADAFDADAWSAETFWSELAGVPSRRRYLAALIDQQLVGYAGLAFAGDDCDVQTVVVDAAYQRAGAGAALLAGLLAHGRAQGCRWCHLEVRDHSPAAMALYQRFGFEATTRCAGYYDGHIDAVIMRLDLAAIGDRPVTA